MTPSADNQGVAEAHNLALSGSIPESASNTPRPTAPTPCPQGSLVGNQPHTAGSGTYAIHADLQAWVESAPAGLREAGNSLVGGS